MFCAETVTGFVGQILDECEIDEKARELLTKLYNIALKELNEENDIIKSTTIVGIYDSTQEISIPCKLNTKTKEVFDIEIPKDVENFDLFLGFYLTINNKVHLVSQKSEAKPDEYWYSDK